jgi:hypothetical protein
VKLSTSNLASDIFEGDSRRGGIWMASVVVAIVAPELDVEFRATQIIKRYDGHIPR